MLAVCSAVEIEFKINELVESKNYEILGIKKFNSKNSLVN
jgi:hypothetical protein